MAANPSFLNWREVSDQILSLLPPAWRAGLTGKVMTRLSVAYALAMEQAYATIAQTLRLSIISTSENKYLRALISGFGMTAYDGIAAQVTVRFTRYNDIDTILAVPAGTQVGSISGVRFKTLEVKYFQPGQSFIEISCEALRTGATGNVGAGEIVALLTPVSGVDEVRNQNAFTREGVDAEPDADIKRRVPPYIASLHRATIPSTEYAIRFDPLKFPEVKEFITRRNYGTPGYFLGILSDTSGGDSFRVPESEWTLVGDGIYVVATSLAEVNGVVAYGFPCIRFGVYSRNSITGEEEWSASAFVSELPNLTWAFVHDKNLGRVYARADGRDLNSLNITLVSGVLWRAKQELELQWAANGVFLDIVAPFAVRQPITITYTLEPDYVPRTVEIALSSAVTGYVSSLGIGQDFEAEGAYAALALVDGAAGVIISLGNVTVAEDSVFRLSGFPSVTRRAA